MQKQYPVYHKLLQLYRLKVDRASRYNSVTKQLLHNKKILWKKEIFSFLDFPKFIKQGKNLNVIPAEQHEELVNDEIG
jgi:hypothetical protein